MRFFDEFKHIKSDDRELRKFGITIGTALIILSGILYLKHHRFNPLLLWQIPSVSILAALLFPKCLWPFQKLWMALSLVMGFVMTRIILGILFYLIMTPIGQIAKLAGKDLLNLKFDKAAKSYWNIRDRQTESQPEDYEKQF